MGGQQPQAAPSQNFTNGPSVHTNIPTPSSSNGGSGFLSQEQQDALVAQQLAQGFAQQAAQPEDYVRPADQVVTDRLVGPYVNQFGSGRYQQQRDLQQNFSKEWKKGPKNARSGYLGQLFSDPEYRFKGDWEAAKHSGQNQNKWLLVNIQDTETFTSHCLNRDVWKDKELGPVIQESFVFYQWIRSTDNARRIINLYHPRTFPCILVIDPSTGRQDYEFTVPEEPDKVVTLKAKLLEFLDDYPNPKIKPKKRTAVPQPQSMVPHMSHDDKLLQEALAASMADATGGDQDKEEMKEMKDNSNDVDIQAMAVDEPEEEEPEPQQEPEKKLEDLLEAEPESSDSNATAIRIRMPTGGVAQRLFRKDAKVEQLYIWSRLSLDGRAVSLLQTMPRLRLDDQKEKTLKELGLIRATLVCSYED